MFAQSRITLDAEHHTKVPFHAALLAGKDYIFEPCFWTDSNHNPVLTAPNGLINKKTDGVMMLNMSSTQRRLEKRQLIGWAHPLSYQTSAYNTTLPVPWSESVFFPSQHFSNSADIPDSSDRDPPPHSKSGPTYCKFDVALGPDGKPNAELCQVLDKCRDAFTFDGQPGLVKDVKVSIPTTDDGRLPAEPPCMMSPKKRGVTTDTITQLLEWGVIEPSESPVSHGVVLVKQNQKWRFCVNF